MNTGDRQRARVLIIMSRNRGGGKDTPRLTEYLSDYFATDVVYVDLPLYCPDWAMLLPAVAATLGALPRINRYDIVVSGSFINGFSLAVLQSLFGQFVIRPKHIMIDAGATRYLGNAGGLMLFLLRCAVASVKAILCYAGSSAEFWKKRVGFGGKCCSEYLYADATYFEPVSSSEGDYIFSAGRVSRDFSSLIEAFNGIGEKLVIIGDKAGLESVKDRIVNAPAIEYHVEKYGDYYVETLKKARFVVIPLKDSAYHAGQTVLIQAMAAGKAVIATRSAGTIGYIDDGVDGILVEGGDPAALREAIQRLLGDRDARGRMGENARRKALMKFSEKGFSQRLRAHIQELLSPAGSIS